MGDSDVPRPAGAVLVDYRSRQGPALTAVRGAMLLANRQQISSRGYQERYLGSLSDDDRTQLADITALSWTRVELASAHFVACDALELSQLESIEQGVEAARAMGPAMLGTMLRAVGASPLTAVAALGRVWDRIHQGGECVAIQTGLKDLFIEQRGNPLASSRFYRLSSQGFYRSLAELFCTRAYVKAARPTRPSGQSFAVTISWV